MLPVMSDSFLVNIEPYAIESVSIAMELRCSHGRFRSFAYYPINSELGAVGRIIR